ncbi:MAG: hypothetical protein U0572_02815 [Phycisphaerales bacterium]
MRLRSTLVHAEDAFTPTVAASLMATAVACASVIAHSPPLWRAIFAPNAAVEQPSLASNLAQHERDANTSAARFVGRSMFFAPSPPQQPRVEREAPAVEPTIAARPLPASPTYTGPEITGFLDNCVFLSGRPMRAGETIEGVTLLDAESPNCIRVRFTAPGHEPGDYLRRVWEIHTQGFEPGDRNRR